jgi:hypothetical protein
MTQASTTPRWGRWTGRSIAVLIIALVIGAGIGLLVNVASPNPVYGIQLIADFVAIAVLLLVVLEPPLRGLLPAALGLAIGVIAGVAIGMNLVPRPNPSIEGTVTVRLGVPEDVDAKVQAACFVTDGALIDASTPMDGGLRLADGRWFSVSIGTEKQEPAAVDRPLEIIVTIRGVLRDGSPSETRMTSNASSTVSISNAAETGSMGFSNLVLHELSELRVPIDVAGTVSWDCTT